MNKQNQDKILFISNEKNLEKNVNRTETVLSTQPASEQLVDRILDVAKDNKEAGLVLVSIIASAIATSIILYTISKVTTNLIQVWHKSEPKVISKLVSGSTTIRSTLLRPRKF